LAKVLQVEIPYFFEGYEQLGPILIAQNALDAQTTDKLVGLFRNVPLPRRSQFMELIKNLVSNMAGDGGDT
jgi:hypothetical protein